MVEVAAMYNFVLQIGHCVWNFNFMYLQFANLQICMRTIQSIVVCKNKHRISKFRRKLNNKAQIDKAETRVKYTKMEELTAEIDRLTSVFAEDGVFLKSLTQ